MSKFGWILGGWSELAFKRVPEGWLFAPPSVWPRRTYLVTDEQKVRLDKPLRQMMWMQLCVIFVVCAVLGVSLDGYSRQTYWLAFAIASVVLMAVSWAYIAIVLRPLLGGLAPTQERITFADRFERQAEAMPKAVIIIMALFSLVLFAGGVLVWLQAKWNVEMIGGILLFGLLSIYWIALLVAKQKAKQ